MVCQGPFLPPHFSFTLWDWMLGGWCRIWGRIHISLRQVDTGCSSMCVANLLSLSRLVREHGYFSLFIPLNCLSQSLFRTLEIGLGTTLNVGLYLISFWTLIKKSQFLPKSASAARNIVELISETMASVFKLFLCLHHCLYFIVYKWSFLIKVNYFLDLKTSRDVALPLLPHDRGDGTSEIGHATACL